ncbi:ATP-binding protein [Roseateles cellulosilyticus]|uniref:histidine kinase n=1 Tax=Pelomonas cellulosilytica TaxID=2906762 RepID=A0ABS8XR31_9BURK|nr:ATP-binding protein [Pelomonas sp. P8]MCE4553124.1 ATP-binding protein [Pelomonas sp. P8]
MSDRDMKPVPPQPAVPLADSRHHESAATLQALLQGVRDYAIYTVNPQGLISSWHRGAELMKGYTADEAVGMPFARLFTAVERAAGQPELELQVAAEQGEYKGEGQRVRKDGSRIDVAVVLTALRGPQGDLLGFLKLTQDITARRAEERAREEALRASQLARAEAERASQLKGEFLATLSHELRTPLSAILGWAHVLERGVFDADTLKHGLDAISRNARLQVQLIEDLLDMTRIESGQLRLDRQRVELDGVVAAAIDSALPTAAARGLALTTDFGGGPAGGSWWVLGDPARLQQVFANLLDNSLKFTPRGGRIHVSLQRSATGLACISVKDTGQGIEPSFLPRLFERFQQQDTTTTRRHGGLGIGLAIVRQLVLLHGGEVQAHSAGPGRGSMFTVSLPLELDPSALMPRPVPVSPQQPGRLTGIRVLLVDDELDVRDITAHLLRAAGAQVSTVPSAEEALRLLQQRPPDVLLSDIGMPGCDGYELIQLVRSLPAQSGGGVPAAAFTAYASPDDAERALSAGYQLHLAKPVAAEALVGAVERLARAP